MKSKNPLVIALTTVGWTVAGIVGVFITVSFAISAIFGDESGALYLFSFCFTLFAPIALVTAILVAIRRFVRDRRAEKAHIEKNQAS